MTRTIVALIAIVALSAACGDDDPSVDATVSADAEVLDAPQAQADAATVDADVVDAASVDASLPDATATADAMTADAGVCDIVGDYNLSGLAFIRFQANGAFAVAPSQADLATTTTVGTYMLAGNAITITENFSCLISQQGIYDIQWASGCGSLQMSLVSDPCTQRVSSLDGATLLRL